MKFLAIVLLLMGRATWAVGGTDTGGGGGAVVCRDANGAITSAELLDLYEIRTQGETLRVPVGDIGNEYIEYLQFRGLIETSTLRPLTPNAKNKAINYFMTTLKEHFQMLPSVRPQQTNDFGTLPTLPTGCKLEQLAYFSDQTLKTTVDHEIWHRLDSLNQVALYAHEYFYRRFRLVGETDSMVVRKLVGMAFLKTPRWQVRDGMPAKAMWCSATPADGAGESSFYIYPDADGSAILQFSKLMGRNTLSPTKVKVPFAIKTADFKTEGLRGLTVIQSGAQYSQSYPLIDSPFNNYKVKVQFWEGQPFNLTLLNHADQELQLATVQSCRMAALATLDQELNEYDYVDPDGQVPPELLREALSQYKRFIRQIQNRDYLTVVDMGQHSSRKRFYLIELSTGVVWSTFIAHGRGSDLDDDGWATVFGSKPNMARTALGPFLAAEKYFGKYGASVRIDGLGTDNFNCRSRACRFSGSPGVQDLPVKQITNAGELEIPQKFGESVADVIKGKSFVYVGWQH